MTRFLVAAAFVAISFSAAAQDAPPPAANKLFMLKVAQLVDDRCRIMPPDVRREFDARIARLTSEVEATGGRAMLEEMSRKAPERARANGEACDERTRRFLEGSFVQSAPPR